MVDGRVSPAPSPIRLCSRNPGLTLKNHEEFEDGNRRALNQARLPQGVPGAPAGGGGGLIAHRPPAALWRARVLRGSLAMPPGAGVEGEQG